MSQSSEDSSRRWFFKIKKDGSKIFHTDVSGARIFRSKKAAQKMVEKLGLGNRIVPVKIKIAYPYKS
jgi:hypothetical protein